MNFKVEICGVDTARLPKLTEEEMTALMARVKEGDESAREAFIVGNMRLVLSIVKRFWNKKGSADDVFQAGCVGLIKAIDNFDPRFAVKFSTYAVPMIIGEIKRHFRGGNSLRVARSIRDTAYRALKTREELEAEGKKDPSVEDVAARMEIAASEVLYSLDAISDPLSLYDPVTSKTGDSILLMDQIGDDKNTEELWTERVALAEAMDTLPEREKRILSLRYFEGRTQTEISEEVGISQAQVSRLEKNAIKSVKKAMER